MSPELAFKVGLAVAVIAGFVIGYFTRGFVDKTDLTKKIDPSFIVMIAVTFVFIISVLVDIADPTYQTPLALYGLMGVIVGFFFKPIGNNRDDKK